MKILPQQCPRQVKASEGTVVLQLAFLCTLYFRNAWTPRAREGVSSCIEEFLTLRKHLPDQNLLWYKNPINLKMYRYDEKKAIQPQQVVAALSADESWQFLYHNQESPLGAPEWSLSAMGSTKWEEEENNLCSYLRFTIPIEWISDASVNIEAMILKFCARLKPFHGYAGIGIIQSPDPATEQNFQWIASAMADHFPLLEVDLPVKTTLDLSKGGIKGSNWLTILDDEHWSRLGGAKHVSSALGFPFAYVEYPGGSLIKIGPLPLVSDGIEKKKEFQEYVRLAKALKPIRASNQQWINQHWIERFDAMDESVTGS